MHVRRGPEKSWICSGGSCATRGDDRPESDIDIMVELAPDARIGLFQQVGIVHFLEDMFAGRVDVANRDGR
ncbi:nucleotidyltransferase family protein [Bradyrhizobium sp.]|uniref:nucleotidyltransferase family protein n=1 Tax=Bradyrhizobium sp. TaxID=376 RepID=UPI00351E18A3